MDDLPVFEEVPLRSVNFAPRAIRPRDRSGPVVVTVWAVGLTILGAIGLLAGEPPLRSSTAISEPTPDAPFASTSGLASTRMGALLIREVVNLASPSPARVEITTPSVSVEGSVLVRAARVEIFLEARGNRVLDHVSVDVSDPDGGVRPDRTPRFDASFDLPYPRPNGTMWIVVTAYDGRGMPLGGTRRPFAVGALLEPQPAGTERVDGQG